MEEEKYSFPRCENGYKSLCTQFSASVHSSRTPHQMTDHRDLTGPIEQKSLAARTKSDKLFKEHFFFVPAQWCFALFPCLYPQCRSLIPMGGNRRQLCLLNNYVPRGIRMAPKGPGKAGST